MSHRSQVQTLHGASSACMSQDTRTGRDLIQHNPPPLVNFFFARHAAEAPHAYEVCYGVSHETYSPGQRIITNGQMHTNQITKTK